MNINDPLRAELLFQIGTLLAYPKYGNSGHIGAAIYFRQASKLGHGFSSYCLFLQFENGVGFGRSIPEAMKWLRLSAEQGCPRGMAQYGWRLLNAIAVESHQQNGLDYIQRAADLNDPLGLYYLGCVRLRAIHSYENKEEAVRLFKKAASLGNRESFFMLGGCYESGLGTQRDISKAIECYKRAAILGETSAYACLGRIYFDGDGVPQNKAEGLS
jgi:hypothetical protein